MSSATADTGAPLPCRATRMGCGQPGAPTRSRSQSSSQPMPWRYCTSSPCSRPSERLPHTATAVEPRSADMSTPTENGASIGICDARSYPPSHAPSGNGGWMTASTHWHRHSVLNTSGGSVASAERMLRSGMV